MTITEALGVKAFPPEFAYPFLRKIRYCVPREGIVREGVCPVGSYLVPFVNRIGQCVIWIPFTSEPNTQGVAYVRLTYPADPSRIFRVREDGSLETVCQQVNEDY
jgi:hypothetical protein